MLLKNGDVSFSIQVSDEDILDFARDEFDIKLNSDQVFLIKRRLDFNTYDEIEKIVNICLKKEIKKLLE